MHQQHESLGHHPRNIIIDACRQQKLTEQQQTALGCSNTCFTNLDQL